MLHARRDYNERIQDAANKIPEDEPVFLLRASDALAVHALMAYAQAVMVASGPLNPILQSTRTQITRFISWAQTEGAKYPDMPEGSGIPSDCVSLAEALEPEPAKESK